MIPLVWSNRFLKAVKKVSKKKPDIVVQLGEILEKLENDPYDALLKTHKLKGKLAGSWACSVDYDVRIVFEFRNNEQDDLTEILLLSIGTHDEVY